MPDMTNLIPIIEWAEAHNIDDSTARKKAIRGGFKTAIKIGRQWFIDKDEPNTDNRIKSGKYIGWRNKNNSEKVD